MREGQDEDRVKINKIVQMILISASYDWHTKGLR